MAKSKLDQRKRYQATPKDMELYAEHIKQILAEHVGKQHAITARAIATQLKLYGKNDDRRVRSIITELVNEHKAPFGASDASPMGFYTFATVEEWREYLQTIVVDIQGSWQRYNNIAEIGSRLFGVPVKPINPSQTVLQL